MFRLLGHADEEHAVEESTSFISDILHLPTWSSLLLVGVLLVIVFLLTWKLEFIKRLLIIVASMILIGIAYLPHNASVTGIVLSTGFIMTFLLTFTMLAGTSRK